MCVCVEPVARAWPVVAHDVLLGPEEAPHGHVVDDKLKVKVVKHRLAELGQVFFVQLERAQAALWDVLFEENFVTCVDESVSIHHLAEGLGLVLQGVGAAQWEVIVHVCLTGIRQRAYLVGKHRNVLAIFVTVAPSESRDGA